MTDSLRPRHWLELAIAVEALGKSVTAAFCVRVGRDRKRFAPTDIGARHRTAGMIATGVFALVKQELLGVRRPVGG